MAQTLSSKARDQILKHDVAPVEWCRETGILVIVSSAESQSVQQVVALGEGPWPTLDPFLFCVHHHDDYPIGNDQLGPAASLAGREIG